MKGNRGRILVYWFLGGVIAFLTCSYLQIRPEQTAPYKQIRIPLDKLNGVPFSKDERGEYYIEGFNVDSNENLYFLGGKRATLTCYSKTGQRMYTRSYPKLYPGQMHILGKSLYFFEVGDSSYNTIVEMDKTNGSLIREYPKTITKVLSGLGFQTLYDYEFGDSILKITYTDSDGIEKRKTACFNLKGISSPQCDLHPSYSQAIEKDDEYEHLGKLGNNYVLGRPDQGDRKKYDLTLRDASNAVISNAVLDYKNLGTPICGHLSCWVQEHRRIMNGSLYMLNRQNNVAVITVIDLAGLFSKKGVAKS